MFKKKNYMLNMEVLTQIQIQFDILIFDLQLKWINITIVIISADVCAWGFIYPRFQVNQRKVYNLSWSFLCFFESQIHKRLIPSIVYIYININHIKIEFVRIGIYLSDSERIHLYNSNMGASAGGALNTRGFSYAVQQNQIPTYQHITHAGTYNEHFYEVGNKAKELLELHTGVGVSNCHLFGLPNRNFFMSLFLKSSKDGQPRVRNINACIALDISGSMNSNLSYQKPSEKTRLMLARDAILMFFEKMKQNDIFSLVVFHNQARTVIQSNYVKKMNKEKVRQAIYQQFESGGTTIKSGFDESVKQINRFKADISNYQNRIIMLTDVCDNSVENEKKLIHDIAETNEIGTTIIGVSSDFKAQTCEKLKEVKGFNYFCAVQDSDLKTFLVDRFDWTFFPCVQNISIRLVSDKISDIKVYGSADQQRKYEKQGNKFVISKFTSIFPSQIIENKVKKDEIESLGGLILVKFTPINPQLLPEVDLKILLDYEDLEGHKYTKQYVIKQKVSAEEYYSDSAVSKGVQLFYYAQTMRNLLKTMHENFNQASKLEYLDNLQRLGDYCPQSKKQQLQDVIKIVTAK